MYLFVERYKGQQAIATNFGWVGQRVFASLEKQFIIIIYWYMAAKRLD